MQLDDIVPSRCNFCGETGFGVDSIITVSIPARHIWMGDTYHYGHLPANCQFLHRPVPSAAPSAADALGQKPVDQPE